MATTKKPMGENTRKVLAFLQNAGVGVKFTNKQVQTELGFDKSGYVTGAVTSLVNKKLVERIQEVTTDENGKEITVKYFALTDAGSTFDPDAQTEEE